MSLDSKLDFKEHIKNGVATQSPKNLPRFPFISVYKSFLRLHLDYVDIIYHQVYNVSFHQKLESIQYNVALAITGAIRGTSR